ncbi:MAG: helix-turn-helix transcriptional regulator [Clostridia bacterium]|nr:helix-turn-helix transcriptional regulator [Clostridia bacterium]
MEKLTKDIISQRINETLAIREIKQKELAKALGVTDNTVSYFCSGKRTPNLAQLIEISKFLNVSIEYLLGLTNTSAKTDTEEGKIIRTVCDYIGLSEETVKYLHEFVEANSKHNRNIFDFDFMNFLVMYGFMDSVILQAPKYKKLLKNSVSTLREIDKKAEDNNPEVLLEEHFKTYYSLKQDERVQYYDMLESFRDTLNEYVKDEKTSYEELKSYVGKKFTNAIIITEKKTHGNDNKTE